MSRAQCETLIDMTDCHLLLNGTLINYWFILQIKSFAIEHDYGNRIMWRAVAQEMIPPNDDCLVVLHFFIKYWLYCPLIIMNTTSSLHNTPFCFFYYSKFCFSHYNFCFHKWAFMVTFLLTYSTSAENEHGTPLTIKFRCPHNNNTCPPSFISSFQP